MATPKAFHIGELKDRLKGTANKAGGNLKKISADPNVRDGGKAQKIKGKIKVIINEL